MKVRTASAAEWSAWLQERNVGLDQRSKPVLPNAYRIIEFPSRNPAWSSAGVAYVVSELEEGTYQGGLFVISNLDLGSPELDRIGQCMISAFIGSPRMNVEQQVIFMPGPDELVSFQALLTISIDFGWDAYYVPNDCSFLLMLSHDELLSLVSSADAQHLRIMEQVKNLDPRERVSF